jgi:ATP-binding cassette subfamily B protein
MRQIQDAKLSMDRLQDIHQKENEELDEKSQIQDIPFGLSITVKNMAFSYDPLSNEATLSDITMIIPSGKQTAVVGMSGSGKTTLIKMLLGFYPPDKGEILLGNTNLFNYNIRQWRKKCGVVMQDGFIFSDSIADNIAPGVDKIDSTRLREATDIANIREYIEQLPLNYNTKIGSDGHGLSQGQKQRILIARAVYKNPEFIFFDEATNSLDANNELQIMNNLHSFFKGKTSVIVAHRLSTVKNADQIIVLEKGCIAEIGNHETLIDKKGIYYKLVKNQLNL